LDATRSRDRARLARARALQRRPGERRVAPGAAVVRFPRRGRARARRRPRVEGAVPRRVPPDARGPPVARARLGPVCPRRHRRARALTRCYPVLLARYTLRSAGRSVRGVRSMFFRNVSTWFVAATLASSGALARGRGDALPFEAFGKQLLATADAAAAQPP